MSKVISLNDFKNEKEINKEENKLTKAGKSFRERFMNALNELESNFNTEIKSAKVSSEVKTKINISTVVKHAKSSPLAAYSDLHKEFVESKINEVLARCNQKIEIKFQDKKKPTIQSIQKQLTEERAIHKAELAKLASQKMTEYLNLKDNK